VHESGDVAALTDHLRLVDHDRELLFQLRTRALANAARLTWKDAARRLVDAYWEGLTRYRGKTRG
jgi:hypothetical protein